MNILFPVIFFGLPILAATLMCGWRVVVAFLISVIVTPFFFVFSTSFVESRVKNINFDVEGATTISAMFALPGIPIYLVVALPIYQIIQAQGLNLYWVFPLAVSALSLTAYYLLANKPGPWWVFPVIFFCSLTHSLLIVWLAQKLKSF